MYRAGLLVGRKFHNILKTIHLFIFMKRTIVRKDNLRRVNVYQIDRHGDDLSSDYTEIFFRDERDRWITGQPAYQAMT